MAKHITLTAVRRSVAALACDATEQRTPHRISAEILALDYDLWVALFGRLEHPTDAVAQALLGAWRDGVLNRAWDGGSFRYWRAA